MSVYHGVVRDQVVVLPPGVQVAEGTPVEIRVRLPRRRRRAGVTTEDLFRRRLVETGLLCETKAAYLVEPAGDRTPVQVKGKLLSETIIEERR